MTTLMMLMMIPTMIIMFMTHPLSMGLILLLQTILIALYTNMLASTPWYSYILILIMIGGMLVLFMYMTSVASNEKFKFSLKTLTMVMITFIMSILMTIMDKWLSTSWIMKSETMMINLHSVSLNKFLNFPSMFISATLIIYLLITLIAIIKIIDIKHGPLRHQN